MSQIFISYSRQHPLYADRIEEDLLESGYSVWIDRKEIIGGEDWLISIQKAINTSGVVLVIVTEAAIKSKYVQEEISIAKNLNKICIGLIMERFKKPISAIKRLHLDDSRQHINFEEKGYTNAYKELLRAIKQAIDDWTHIQKIINSLGHFNPSVRKQAIKLLGDTKDARVIDFLIEANLVENHVEVIKTICEIFSFYTNDHRVFSILAQYLSTNLYSQYSDIGGTDDPIRLQAATSLGLLSENNEVPFNELLDEISIWPIDDQLRLSDFLMHDGNLILKQLGYRLCKTYLNSQDSNIRFKTVVILGKIAKDTEAIDYLIPLLSDSDEKVKLRTRRALKYLGFYSHESDDTHNQNSDTN